MKLKISRKFCKITKIKIFLVSNSYRSYSRASCFALVYLKEKVEFILFFNYTKSPDATTFALSSNSILHHHPPQSPHPYNPTPSSLITHPSSPVLGTNSYCWPLESNFSINNRFIHYRTNGTLSVILDFSTIWLLVGSN